MSHIKRIVFVLFTLSCLLGCIQAQTSGNPTVSVTATASAQHIRYVSAGEVNQTRLQIFAADGAQVFDSEFRLGNLINWTLQNQNGARVADGSYVFLVTAKDFSGRSTQKYGSVQVDQEQVYVERTDRGELAQAQAAALESNRQGESLSLIDRIGAVGLATASTPAQRTDSGPGLKPASDAKEAVGSITPNVAGSGTTGKLTLWSDGPSGTLADSIITQQAGSGFIGIGTSTPSQPLQIESAPGGAGTSRTVSFSVPGAHPANSSYTFQVVTGKGIAQLGLDTFLDPAGVGLLSSTAPGGIIFSANNLNQHMRIQANGNVGIGTASPSSPAGFSKILQLEGAFPGLVLNSTVSGRKYTIGSNTNGGVGFLDFYDESAATSRMVVGPTGNVGIGTTTPAQKLDINGNINLPNTGSLGWGNSNQSDYLFGTASSHFIGFVTNNSEKVRIDTNGNLGIGVPNPQSKLDVAGNINVTGNATVSGNIAAKYQDVAEWVAAREELAPGTVVILDAARNNGVVSSVRPYDTLIAGVVSAQPGVILGEGGAGKVMVATTGRVVINVDATRHPIRVGDLLVTSNLPGVAMRSQPIRLGRRAIHRPGTIIGKALEPLAGGKGQILALLTLQ